MQSLGSRTMVCVARSHVWPGGHVHSTWHTEGSSSFASAADSVPLPSSANAPRVPDLPGAARFATPDREQHETRES